MKKKVFTKSTYINGWEEHRDFIVELISEHRGYLKEVHVESEGDGQEHTYVEYIVSPAVPVFVIDGWFSPSYMNYELVPKEYPSA